MVLYLPPISAKSPSHEPRTNLAGVFHFFAGLCPGGDAYEWLNSDGIAVLSECEISSYCPQHGTLLSCKGIRQIHRIVFLLISLPDLRYLIGKMTLAYGMRFGTRDDLKAM